MIEVILFNALVVLVYMSIFFLIASARKDNSIVDVAWGTGFVLIAYFTLLFFGEFTIRQLLVTAVVTLWGLRLAVHIFRRNRGRGEDFRYASMREKWGRYVLIRSFLQIYVLQGFFMLVVAYPVILVNSTPGPSFGWLDLLGLSIWIAGFLFEAVADSQLKEFVKTKKPGEIMKSGLWRYSRHPNYFGEAVQWWGIFIVALSLEGGWWAIVSPILITFLLRFVSGVPYLERKYRQYPKFREYMKETNAFIPWFPKK
jgi:steroid 5-alpha reductase family enzyme